MMHLRRIGILLRKELSQGSKSFIAIFAVVIPLAISVLVALVFGDLLSETPRVGLIDQGDSQIVELFQAQEHIKATLYTDDAELRRDTERGAVDVGIVLPAGFDAALRDNTETDIEVLFWGEGNTTPRATIVFALANHIVTVSGRDVPASVEAVSLGSGEIVSWSERLLPLLVLMSIVLGGTLIPAVSLVDEKAKRTLRALTVTPASLLDIFAAKALLGIGVSVVMGLVILSVNQAFGSQPVLLVLVLALGATVAALLGIVLGSLAKSMNGLFTMIKPMALILYAPAIIEIFPQLPEWLAKVFPTYYIMQPVIEIAQNGAGWAQVGGMLLILAGIGAVLLAALVALTRHENRREALAL